MTVSFASDTARLITQTHRQVVVVTATGADGVPHTLDVEQGSAVLGGNLGRVPRWQLDLTIPVWSGSQGSVFDPRRTATRVTVDAGYLWPSGRQEVQRIADLDVRLAKVDTPADTTTVHAESDEAAVIDRGIDQPVSGAATADAAAEITRWIRDRIPEASVVAQATGSSPAWEANPGDDAWQVVEDLSDAARLETFATGPLSFLIRQQPTVAASSVADLTIGATGTVTGSAADSNRDRFANGCVLTYDWTDDDGTRSTIYGRAYLTVGSTAWGGPTGRRLWTERRTGPVTQAAADAAAATLLDRRTAAGSGVAVDAVAAYWLTPGDTVAVTVPGAGRELVTRLQLVESVTFDLTRGGMRVTTRDPALEDV